MEIKINEKKAIKKITLIEFAKSANGTLVNAEAFENSEIKGISTLEKAEEGEISFISSEKFKEKAKISKASFIIAPEGFTVDNKPVVQIKQIWKGISLLMNHFFPPDIPESRVHTSAVIDKDVDLGDNVAIGPFVVIEEGVKIGSNTIIGAYSFIGKNVTIGSGCILHPRVTLMKRTEIGNRVIIHPGAVIGDEGFKYEVIDGRITKIPQIGKVIIEDEVEIGANAAIDRASLTETRIGAMTKIDNLVQIAHNVVIGKGCLIVSQVGIAGSSKVGNGCIFGGQVGIADNVEICDGVMLAARSGVAGSMTQPGAYLGAPPMPAKEGAKIVISQRYLPDTIKKVRELEKEVAKLKKNI